MIWYLMLNLYPVPSFIVLWFPKLPRTFQPSARWAIRLAKEPMAALAPDASG